MNAFDFQNGKLTIVLLNECNLNCSMCFIKSSPGREQLTKDEAFAVGEFGIANKFKLIEITGGEPFLVPYLTELLAHLCHRSEGSSVFLTTNGTVINPKQLDFLKELPHLHLQISIDGVGPTHDGIRKSSRAFEKAETTIRELDRRQISFSINTVIQKANTAELVNIFKTFSRYNYRYHAFSLYEPSSPNPSLVEIVPDKADEVEEGLQRIVAMSAEAGKNVVLTQKLIDQYVSRIKTGDSGVVHPGLLCTIPKRGMIIDQRGHVFPSRLADALFVES